MADTSLIFNLLARDRASRVLRGVGSAANRMSGVIVAGGAAAAAGLLAMAPAMISTSNAIGALDVKAKTVFEGQLPKVNTWADANKKAFGATRREVVGMAANMADLLKPMGFTSAQAATMSTKMLDLSGALSRWSGGTKSAAEVSEILSAAMLGETDSLKGLGIAISAADIQARIAKKGQEDLTGAARTQAEAIATQELILEKSTDAQKAWADGGKSAAEAQNGMNTQIAEAKEKLAKGLTPAITAGMKHLTAFGDWASKNQGTVKNIAVAVGALAGTVLLVSAAMKVYVAGQAVVAAATTVWAFAQTHLNFAFLASPITWIILAIALVVVAIVLVATKTTWFQTIWQVAFVGVWAIIKKVWNWIKNNWKLLLAILTGPIGLAVFVIAKHWTTIKVAASAAWGFIKRGFSATTNAITAPFRAGAAAASAAFGAIKRAWNNTIGGRGFTVPAWIPGVGGRSFHIPRFHLGGVVGGPVGAEQLALVRGGETIRTREQERLRGGGHGVVEVRLVVDGADEDLMRLMRRMVRVRGRGNVQVAFGR